MTHTSLNNYPGLLIWHSNGLVNRKPIAKAGFLLFYSPKFYRGPEISSDSISYVTEKRSSRIYANSPVKRTEN